MLEGMAPAQARAVHEVAGDLLMYAPVVSDDDFDASIAYLTRRLDENTQPANFLRALFTLAPHGAGFDEQADRFRAAVAGRHDVERGRRRRPIPVDGAAEFENEPDADLTDADVRRSVEAAIERALGDRAPLAPAPLDDEADVDEVLATAVASHRADRHGYAARRRWLLDAAALMSAERAETVAVMVAHGAKTVREADPEVSEAIDFCRYDASEGSALLDRAASGGRSVAGRGVVVVVGPWNFPYAIPAGGVAAAIAAGCSVVLKPAPEVVEIGAHLVDQLHRAGVPRDVLQLVTCEDGPVGRHLVTHPDVDTVVLTGSHQTARAFLDWRPDRRVLAETSGKDALVVTPSADRDQAIADLVRSAFGHAGQKCSAASLAIVVGEVHDDPSFARRLRDAVTSLRVGPPEDPSTMVGPLIAPPGDDLLRGLTRLEPGESWLVEPRPLDGRPPAAATLWSPGVRTGVRPGSWFHVTECFGPVLGVLRADDLDHAIELQNATGYGLTGGIHSLDDGNAYVNRHITGAVVRRQPFGGWKRSSVGGGAKAGGPGYVAQLARIVDREPPAALVEGEGRATTEARVRDVWQRELAVDHDPSGLEAEANVLRHVPLRRVAVRHDGSTPAELELLRLIAGVTGIELEVSAARDEPDGAFARRLAGAGRPVDRLRLLAPLDDDARRALHEAGIPIDADPPVAEPAVELRRWVREQAISRTLHRHGRLVG